MKATKKIVSVILAITLAVVAFVMPVSAAKVYPLVIVDGIFSTPLYKNVGTADEAPAFATDDAALEEMIKEVLGSFIGGCINFGVAKKDYNAFADKFYPVVNKYIEPIGYNADGTSKDATVGFKQNEKPMSEYTEEEKAGLSVFAEAYAKDFGEENVYNFSYDWRESPIDSAAQLADYIDTVKDDLGVKKVNVVGYSMGANVVLAYLAANGAKSINNLVFVSPAWQGTSLAGNVAKNNIEFDMFTVENYLVQLANVSATTHITAFIISYIATYDGLSKEYFGDINKAVSGILPRLYTDTVIPNIAGMPGFWSLIPAEDYEAGKDFLFGDAIDANLEAKIDAYNEIQTNAKSIIEDAMDDGMNFGIVVGYNCQMIPISDEYEQSDTIIDVKYASGGATCSKYLQAFDDWTNIYSQKVKCGHNHVSWDYKIDASTCMFPEQTWFYKNLQHSAYNVDEGTTDVIVWLLSAEEQMTVNSDKENYPQFSLYNTYKRKVTPIAMDQIIGDIDNSGAVTTEDARLALKVAAGQKKLAEDKVKYGDIDEDGKITTSDAKDILAMAAGIDF
ncbi:MAG: alpha/beta fold hydrolase [Acutalibacteraceae bacterium]|nr:alpha/beta fold hydrolase [Acutalibacteraceae bacterium]